MSGKEAIIFIVDANHSMNAPYPDSNNGQRAQSQDKSNGIAPSSRLDVAKEAMLHTIITMAWQSSQHEFGVVVLKTKNTHHHLSASEEIYTQNISRLFGQPSSKNRDERTMDDDDDDDDRPFPNLIEIDFTKPTHHLLSTLRCIRSTTTPQDATSTRGDFCDGIILAADTLYRRTFGKKYKRRILLFTDAEHEVQVDAEQLECVLGGLRKMECKLEVVGMGFCHEGEFVVKKEEEDCEDTGDTVDLCDPDDEQAEDFTNVKVEEDENDAVTSGKETNMIIKRENEKLLISLAQQTGGCVLAANGQDVATLLDEYHSKRTNVPQTTRRAVRSKCLFRITPDLTIDARYSKIIDPKFVPSLKTDAYLLDETTGKPIVDGGGEFMTTAIDSILFHTLALDPNNPDKGTIEVPQESRTDAYRFGSDLIPLGKMDMAGINAAFKSPKSVEIIGYIPSREVLASGLCLGPAYALYGGRESKRSMFAVAALAEAMEEKDLWGYCRFVKSLNGDPKLAVLVPQKVTSDSESVSTSEGNVTPGGRYFALLQLPFADDVNYLKPPQVPLEHWGDNRESTVCDELIDSLMIPDDQLDSTTIFFPAVQSYQRMIAQFAMNPIKDEKEREGGLSEERILEACRASPLCELDIVKMLSKNASKQIDLFLKTFPLVKNTGDGKKPERKYWGDGS
ncbi:hypothetical protein HJC23_001814 [Cyclotella cryptica]|uniref:Ku domain-containing protein n=1 Tax=Cyclotella cryptica TaxID=29204 RepID=A0ABD3PHI3_9STRA|eukprot:CCRYP_014512-RA/>CCRYP_014512-RA protein AED:0.00 eAED:0.00 QI:59/-1/1/1/-1/1/1/601/678